MDKKIKISIIIPVHNQFNLLDKCLKSIALKTDKNIYDYEIILSDSNSDEKLKEFYELLCFTAGYSIEKRIKIISDNKKPGFSRAINNGMKLAWNDSDYYVWLNSDTLVTMNWLFNITQYDLCSPISNNASYQTVLQIDKKDINKVEEYLLSEQIIEDLQTTFLNGFCYVISKKVFQTVGFLDEVYFPHYGSEDDYSLRAKLKGFKAYILANNFVYHVGNQSYQTSINAEIRQNAKVFLSRYPKDWFNQEIFKHTILTRNLRLTIVERFIDYVNKNRKKET